MSGLKLHWWNVYQEFFDAGIVNWESLDQFASNPIELPVVKIPINRQVKYKEPKPRISLEDEVDFPFKEPEESC